MKKLRVLVLMHEALIPPDTLKGKSEKEIAEWKTEYDVLTHLREMGHDAQPVGLSDDLGKLRREIEQFQPHVAFNLMEEFHGISIYDQHVVSYLELLKQPYTGCNPRGLTLAHDKALCKQILAYHRILTPKFEVYPLGRKIIVPKRLRYPLLVKSTTEEASAGISQASVVTNEEKLKDRVAFIYDSLKSDALVEEYIEGRELYVSVLGNQRLTVYPIWEMVFTRDENTPLIATRRVKWNRDYQKKLGVETRAAELPDGVEAAILRQCRRIYKALYLSGYARIDLRLAEDGKAYMLEANPNPNLSDDEDFAASAAAADASYNHLLQKIMTLGMDYKAAWRPS